MSYTETWNDGDPSCLYTGQNTSSCRLQGEQSHGNFAYIFIMSIWAVFTPVFLYYLIMRRAKLEYAVMLLFSVCKFTN